MIIIYGTLTQNIDITNFCINNLMENDKICIPSGIKIKNLLFSDPAPDMEKTIYVQNNNNTLYHICPLDKEIIIYYKNTNNILTYHNKLKLNYGLFNEELPEQRLSCMFLQGHETVLEIGGNIGRNSLIISSILKDDSKLVVMESDENISNLLMKNKELNNLNFNIETKALCKNKLMQKEWDTLEGDILIDGYKWIDVCDYNYLKNKYKINFDTLIIDCEGGFYYILRDFPEILENINLIIMENDYKTIDNYLYIQNILNENNFKKVYIECLNIPSPPQWVVCLNNFYEVWKKSNNDNIIEIYTSQIFK